MNLYVYITWLSLFPELACETIHSQIKYTVKSYFRLQRKIVGLKRGRKWQKDEEDCIMRSFIICALHQVLLQ